MVIYGYVSSKLSERKTEKNRRQSVPIVQESIKSGCKYSVHLSDGRVFHKALFLGEISNDQGLFVLGGYEGMVVLEKEDGKKVYCKKTAIRFVEET